MLVIFALTLPLVLALGSLTVTVGNWYVHQKRLQTLVDSAALAGGGVFVGCGQDVNAANAAIANKALQYAGDTTRSAGTYNHADAGAGQGPHRPQQPRLLEEGRRHERRRPRQHRRQLERRRSSERSGYALLQRLPRRQGDGQRSADALGLAPVRREPEDERARRDAPEGRSLSGMAPSRSASPRRTPNYVAAIVVNEDAANWQTNASAVVGAGLLTKTTPSPVGLESFAIWQGSLASVNLNGASDFGVFVLTSRNSTAPSLTGSLDTICNQTPSPASQVVLRRIRRRRDGCVLHPRVLGLGTSPGRPPGGPHGRLCELISLPRTST